MVGRGNGGDIAGFAVLSLALAGIMTSSGCYDTLHPRPRRRVLCEINLQGIVEM